MFILPYNTEIFKENLNVHLIMNYVCQRSIYVPNETSYLPLPMSSKYGTRLSMFFAEL